MVEHVYLRLKNPSPYWHGPPFSSSVHVSICPRVHLSSCPGVPPACSRAPGPCQPSRYLTLCLPVLGFLFHFLFLYGSVPHLSVVGSQLSRRHGSPAWVAFPWFTRLLLGSHSLPASLASDVSFSRALAAMHMFFSLCSPHGRPWSVLPLPPQLRVAVWLLCPLRAPLWWSDATTTLSRLSFPPLFTPFIPRLPPLLCASLLPFPHLTLSSTQGLHLLKGRRLLQPFIQEGLNLLEPVVHEQGGVHPGNRGPSETCAPYSFANQLEN